MHTGRRATRPVDRCEWKNEMSDLSHFPSVPRPPACAGRHAFTLIELLIVVALVGIAATVLLGVVSRQAESARSAATADTVRGTRQAIDLYKEQTGTLPDLISGWDALLRPHTVRGRPVGPFLSGPPRNLAVAAASGNASCVADGNLPVIYLDQCSFLYDYNAGDGTGRFIASYTPRPTNTSAVAASLNPPIAVAGSVD
jgi:prepilin-type N-terminal cleavage/methylation domain-containing protein